MMPFHFSNPAELTANVKNPHMIWPPTQGLKYFFLLFP